jgi:predicted TIM-barrel fold metal-dependent hydrolase
MHRIFDTHLHLCCRDRFDEFAGYLRLSGVHKAVSLSLPDLTCGNFNAEVLDGKRRYPSVLYAFGSLDYRRLKRPSAGLDWIPTLAAQVEQMWARGFDGLKLWIGKPGFQARLGFGPEHPEVFSALETARRLDFPVLIHAADPPQFWHHDDDLTRQRLGVPVGIDVHGFEYYLRQAEAIPANHPGLRIVFAHLLFLAGNLPRAAALLQQYPNVYLDLAPGLYMYPALSVQRSDAREFFDTYRERILFGSDGFWFPPQWEYLSYADLNENLERPRRLLRFLETNDEMPNPFVLERDRVPVIRGLSLPKRVLDTVLWANGESVFGATPRTIVDPETRKSEENPR